MHKQVQEGNEVHIHYVGKLKDGRIFDYTKEQQVFKFVAGSKNIIPGMNRAVSGMKVGEKKIVEIAPDLAYGIKKEKLIVKVPRKQIPPEVKIGDVLSHETTGKKHWVVKEMDNSWAVLDGNHPLAGQTLIFEIEVVDIQ